jgi:hypothetical protein
MRVNGNWWGEYEKQLMTFEPDHLRSNWNSIFQPVGSMQVAPVAKLARWYHINCSSYSFSNSNFWPRETEMF